MKCLYRKIPIKNGTDRDFVIYEIYAKVNINYPIIIIANPVRGRIKAPNIQATALFFLLLVKNVQASTPIVIIINPINLIISPPIKSPRIITLYFNFKL